MGRKRLTFLFFWFGVGFAQAAEPIRFHLDLNSPSLKAGDEAEWTIRYFHDTCETNSTQGQDETTNLAGYFELQGREKVLNWNVPGDWSKVDFTIKHLLSGDGRQTNEVLSPGTHLMGTSIAGDEFFQIPGAHLSEAAYQWLKQSWPIRPRDFNELTSVKAPPSVAVGDSWEIPAPALNSQAIGQLGSDFTNGVKATGCFIGTTNLFGLDCFHMQVRITSTNTPDFLRQIVEARLPVKFQCQITLIEDVIKPFDATQKSFQSSRVLEISDSFVMAVDGKIARSSHGRMTTRQVSQFQFLPQKS